MAALRAATIATRIQPNVQTSGLAPSAPPDPRCCTASNAPASANGSANTEWLNRTNEA
jgi:hypothetical protein